MFIASAPDAPHTIVCLVEKQKKMNCLKSLKTQHDLFYYGIQSSDTKNETKIPIFTCRNQIFF